MCQEMMTAVTYISCKIQLALTPTLRAILSQVYPLKYSAVSVK